jgi:hypothetical protein
MRRPVEQWVERATYQRWRSMPRALADQAEQPAIWRTGWPGETRAETSLLTNRPHP